MPEDSLLLRHVPANAQRVLVCADAVDPIGPALRARGVQEIVAVVDGPLQAGTAPGADQVLPGTLETVADALPHHHFDAVLCDGQLARVRDHAACLAMLSDRIKPGGTLAALVPNLQYYEHVLDLLEGRWEYQPDTALDRRNLRFFTAFSLAQAVKTAGFVAEQVMIAHMAPANAINRDADGHLLFGRFTLGPFDEHGFNCYRARTLLVAAQRPGARA